MDEDALVEAFVKDISTYPFKTHIQKEVNCQNGRVDIVLPDYNVAIEAKADGSIKKAIGQSVWYDEVLGMNGYVLLPPEKVTQTVVDVCKRGGIGLLTTTETSANFAVVYDNGGFESFHPKRYTNINASGFEQLEDIKTDVVGGTDPNP